MKIEPNEAHLCKTALLEFHMANEWAQQTSGRNSSDGVTTSDKSELCGDDLGCVSFVLNFSIDERIEEKGFFES